MASADASATDEGVVVEILQCARDGDVDASKLDAPDFKPLEQLSQTLRSTVDSQNFFLGFRLPEKHNIQITREYDAAWYGRNVHRLGATPFVSAIQELVPGQQHVFHAALDRSLLGLNGPATANIVEFTMVSFPVSRITAELKARIEADSLEFERISSEDCEGDVGFCYGWVLEDSEHPSVPDAPVESFLFVKGWESVDHFRRSTSSDAFKEALPIFRAWKAPAEVWLIERGI